MGGAEMSFRAILLRIVIIVVSAAAVVALVACFLMLWLLPKLSYRSVCKRLSENSTQITAVCISNGQTVALTSDQALAVVTWALEYRSENNGVERIDSIDPTLAEIRLSLPDGSSVSLFPDRDGVCFKGYGGFCRVKAADNQLFLSLSIVDWD